MKLFAIMASIAYISAGSIAFSDALPDAVAYQEIAVKLFDGDEIVFVSTVAYDGTAESARLAVITTNEGQAITGSEPISTYDQWVTGILSGADIQAIPSMKPDGMHLDLKGFVARPSNESDVKGGLSDFHERGFSMDQAVKMIPNGAGGWGYEENLPAGHRIVVSVQNIF